MNYNQFSNPKVFSELPINSRAKLDTGTQCNYKCNFCYYINDLDKITPVEEIKRRADIIFNSGIREVDLSGGESTIHTDWFEILDYCSSKFYKVSCLSNGSKLKDFSFAEKSQQHGLSEVLFSLHGHNEHSHDEIVKHKKAFKHMLQAIDNCKILGIKVRLNCTVTSDNVENMQEYAELVKKLEPCQINFLPLNYWADADDAAPESYEVLSDGIHKAIEILYSEDIQINVRYIPFCFMKGMEEYVVDTYQHIFDENDWNIMSYGNKTLKNPSIEDYYETAFKKRNQSYYKPRECFKCKYFRICDGIENNLANLQGVYPSNGILIEDVMEFRDGKRV